MAAQNGMATMARMLRRDVMSKALDGARHVLHDFIRTEVRCPVAVDRCKRRVDRVRFKCFVH